MRTFPDLRMRQLVWDVHRAQKCLDDGEYEQARDLFLELGHVLREGKVD